jgi:hypothetical protein
MTPPRGGQLAVVAGPAFSLPGACFLPRFERKRGKLGNSGDAFTHG